MNPAAVDPMMDVLLKLAVTIPSAVAVIVTVVLFLKSQHKRDDSFAKESERRDAAYLEEAKRRDEIFVKRMAESQTLGHQVATELAERFERSLGSVTTSQTESLRALETKSDRVAGEVANATREIVKLCVLIETRIAANGATGKAAGG
jgi:hypothetical protein